MLRRTLLLAVGLMLILLVSGTGAHAAIVPIKLRNKDGVVRGSVTVTLSTGAVSGSVKLSRLPATIDTGTVPFTATIYKAYLASSLDPAAEVPLATLYPTAKGTAPVRAALRGDLRKLGLDRIVVVAYSSDGLSSFDVLTGTVPAQ